MESASGALDEAQAAGGLRQEARRGCEVHIMNELEPRELSAERVDALVRLLADDSERIRQVAEAELKRGGAPVIPLVQESARASQDSRVRAAAQRFLRDSRRETALARWEGLATRRELDLETGALLVAQVEFPSLDPEVCRRALDGYAEVLKQRIRALRSADAVIDRMNLLLFRELGFRGNRADYYDPRNSYLNLVLERKLGIPISLSAIYLLVARRVGQKVEGVGMPGHFILRYRVGRRTQFLDPFDGGRRMTHQDCVAHLTSEGYGFREEYLRAVEDREILARMLANLLGIYHQHQDAVRTDRVTRMLAGLQSGP